MGTSTIVAWVIVLALARLLYNHGRLNALPGPFYAGLSDIWRIDARKASKIGSQLVELHEKYGTIVRVGPNLVSVSNPAAILPVQARRIPRQRQPSQRSLATARSDATVEQRRSALQYEGLIDPAARNLINAFRRYHVLELTEFLSFFASDFVHRLKAIASREEDAEDHHVRDTSPDRGPGDLRAWLTLPGAEYLLFQGPVSRLKRGRDIPIVHREHPSSWSDTRDDSSMPRPAARIISEGTPYPSEEILDSVANAFASLFARLLSNVAIMGQLRREIAFARNRGALSILPLWTELNNLQYLDAVMKECIRHSPNLCYFCELIAPTGGVTIAGHYVPQGTAIGCHSHALHYNSDIYGEQSHLFCPERWLNATATQWEYMTQCLFPFTRGGFDHPKVRTAWLELKKVVVMILLQFDLQLVSVGEGSIRHPDVGPGLPSATVRFDPRVH